jgi:hypothetical protein
LLDSRQNAPERRASGNSVENVGVKPTGGTAYAIVLEGRWSALQLSVVRPKTAQVELSILDHTLGINQRLAQIIVAEIGLDMSRF